MTVKQAKQALATLPDDAILMVASQGHGGSVPLQGFQDLDAQVHVFQNPITTPHWIDVVYCEDHEREDYGVSDSIDAPKQGSIEIVNPMDGESNSFPADRIDY